MATDSTTDTEYRTAILTALSLAIQNEDADIAEALTDFAEAKGWQSKSAKKIASKINL